MNYKQLNEKSKKILEQSKVKKIVDIKKNNTVKNIIKTNQISKNSVDKKKTTKNHSPEEKLSFPIKTDQSQNKENVLSPKQATSNYINFTKRSINIKQVMTNQSEVSKESNVITNNSVLRNSDFNSKFLLTQDKNKSNITKIPTTSKIAIKPTQSFINKELKRPLDKQLTFIKTTCKESKFLLDVNKTIDLTGCIKISNIINTPQNKVTIGKDIITDQKTLHIRQNEYKSSLISSKNGN